MHYRAILIARTPVSNHGCRCHYDRPFDVTIARVVVVVNDTGGVQSERNHRDASKDESDKRQNMVRRWTGRWCLSEKKASKDYDDCACDISGTMVRNNIKSSERELAKSRERARNISEGWHLDSSLVLLVQAQSLRQSATPPRPQAASRIC